METGKYPYGYYQMMGYLYSLPVFIILFIVLDNFMDFNPNRTWLYFPAIVLLPPAIFSQAWERIHAGNVRNKTKRQITSEWIGNLLTGLLTIFILYMLFTQSIK